MKKLTKIEKEKLIDALVKMNAISTKATDHLDNDIDFHVNATHSYIVIHYIDGSFDCIA